MHRSRAIAGTVLRAYCSHCRYYCAHEFTGVRQVKGWVFTTERRVHRCTYCQNRTLSCATKDCPHLAAGNTDPRSDDKECAECASRGTFRFTQGGPPGGESGGGGVPRSSDRGAGPRPPPPVSGGGAYLDHQGSDSDESNSGSASSSSASDLGAGSRGSSGYRTGQQVEIWSKSGNAWLAAQVITYDLNEDIVAVSYTSVDDRSMEKAVRCSGGAIRPLTHGFKGAKALQGGAEQWPTVAPPPSHPTLDDEAQGDGDSSRRSTLDHSVYSSPGHRPHGGIGGARARPPPPVMAGSSSSNSSSSSSSSNNNGRRVQQPRRVGSLRSV